MARGDQIYVIRPFLNIPGVYEHHGIDCGDGSVIHYRKKVEVIERNAIETFTQGKKVYLREYTACFIPDVAIHRAESRLGERKYNLLFNNCEHFATWCKTGVSHSKQVQDFLPVLNHLDTAAVYEPLKQALQGTSQDRAQQLLNQALADIKVAWDDLQPQYNQAQQEANNWQKVAAAALKNNREDLARAALAKKLDYQQQAVSLEVELKKLATMTETLIRNSQVLGN